MRRALSLLAVITLLLVTSVAHAGQLVQLMRVGGTEQIITPMYSYLGNGIENMAGDFNGDGYLDWIVQANPHVYGIDGTSGAVLFDYFDADGRLYMAHLYNYDLKDPRPELVLTLRNLETHQVDSLVVYKYVNDAEVSVPPSTIARSASLGVFPNPATHRMTLFLSGVRNEDVMLDVYDVNGRKVAEIFHGKVAGPSFQHEWNPGLSSGIYFLHAFGQDLDITSRAVIIR